jgi:hypothetical protein
LTIRFEQDDLVLDPHYAERPEKRPPPHRSML